MSKQVMQRALDALEQMVESVAGVDQVSAVNEARAAIAELRAAIAKPAQIPEAAILRRAKYHLWPADDDGPESYEIYSEDVDCDDCIDVLIVRVDMLAAPSTKE